mmetsp:Transcript_70173/g.121505  ORF Transcript_70173/g.121505 Transcript_70173/m.121505 type:complete len:140 (-) Transcript_70173:899-1318(-)
MRRSTGRRQLHIHSMKALGQSEQIKAMDEHECHLLYRWWKQWRSRLLHIDGLPRPLGFCILHPCWCCKWLRVAPLGLQQAWHRRAELHRESPSPLLLLSGPPDQAAAAGLAAAEPAVAVSVPAASGDPGCCHPCYCCFC